MIVYQWLQLLYKLIPASTRMTRVLLRVRSFTRLKWFNQVVRKIITLTLQMMRGTLCLASILICGICRQEIMCSKYWKARQTIQTTSPTHLLAKTGLSLHGTDPLSTGHLNAKLMVTPVGLECRPWQRQRLLRLSTQFSLKEWASPWCVPSLYGSW